MPNLYHVQRLHEELQSTLFRDTVTKARAEFGFAWEWETDQMLGKMFPGRDSLVAPVAAYERFCSEIMRLQIDFDRTGIYAPQSYAQADLAVYQNAEYMRDCYLPGLLLAWYLWPHHYRQLRFFETRFVPLMSLHGTTSFYEVATGTGLYSRIALQGAQGAVGTGFDISPASVAFTRDHMVSYALTGRYSTFLRNVLEDPPPQTDWLICVELLEHLEDPMVLLRALRAMLRPGGWAFVATAINAPNSDHIWLYRSGEEVVDHLHLAGFRVEAAELNAAYPGETPPTVAAFIVS